MSKSESKKSESKKSESIPGGRVVNALIPFVELTLIFMVLGLVVAFIVGGA